MKADLTRSTFRAGKHYSRVLSQQGRVGPLDSEWNEQADIVAHRIEAETRDTVGPCGGPWGSAGFALTAGNGDLEISAGRYYVDGILCENDEAVAFSSQPDYPGALLPTSKGTYFAYLDVWQHHVTALEDSSIRETALGGVDTTTRAKTVWQLKLLEVDSGATCAGEPAAWKDAIAPSSGKLGARAKPGLPSSDPCLIEPGAGYRRLENQLYRVEIHQGGMLGTATFKWSRDNGSILVQWVSKSGNELKVSSLGRDEVLGFSNGQWIELTDDTHELQGVPGTLVRITQAQSLTLTIDPATATGSVEIADFPNHPRIRRWDMASTDGAMAVKVPASNNGFIELEDGVQVKFASGSYRAGDYWMIPARTATGDVEWSFTDPQSPQGIEHHYCRPAVLTHDGASWTKIVDCRSLFPAATELTGLYYVSGDGQEGEPAQALPWPLQVGVAMGRWPVAGATVRFGVKAGTGVLQGAGTSVDVLTGSDGIAECKWQLDSATANQRVEAVLLDSAGTAVHLPVRFNSSIAGTSIAPGIRVTELRWSTGDTLLNDTEVAANIFAGGIEVVCEEEIERDTVRQRPTCFVTLEMPFPFNESDFGLWGESVIGYSPLIPAANTSVSGKSISWKPTKESGAWMQQKLFAGMSKLKRGTRILARLTLLGNFIWSRKNPDYFLDGDTFGSRESAGNAVPTDLILPSGDGRRGGRFEMWFWLVAPQIAEVSISVKPTSAAVALKQSASFQVTVEGTEETGTEWSVEGVTGGNRLVGTVAQSEESPGTWIYTAPSKVPESNPVTIVAVSTADRSKTAKARVTVEGTAGGGPGRTPGPIGGAVPRPSVRPRGPG